MEVIADVLGGLLAASSRTALLAFALTWGLSPAFPAESAKKAVIKDLAPTGKLRAAINLGNSVLAQANPATGEPKGITPDLARELASRLGVPVELVTYPAAGKAFDAVKNGEWDIASGFVADAIKRANQSASVAPPAAK